MSKKTSYSPAAFLPTEAEEQKSFFDWCDMMSKSYPQVFGCMQYAFHIPNGGSRNPAEAVNLRRQGVRSGVPDIFIPFPYGGAHGLFIEMKRQKGGRLSAKQRWYIEYLSGVGYKTAVCNGFSEARQCVIDYLGGELK